MSEINPETVRQFLGLELSDYHGHATAREFLLALLRGVWTKGEEFDGKRPFGNSSWDYDLYAPMIKAGLVSGSLDEDGYIQDVDSSAACAIVLAAIEALDVPREAEPEPAKGIVVTENGYAGVTAKRAYSATSWGTTPDGKLNVVRGTLPIATYQPHGWVSVREDDEDLLGLLADSGGKVNQLRALLVRAVRELADSGSPGQNRLAAELARDGGIEL